MNSAVEEVIKRCRYCNVVLIAGENWSLKDVVMRNGNKRCSACRKVEHTRRKYERGRVGFLRAKATELKVAAKVRARKRGQPFDSAYMTHTLMLQIVEKCQESNCSICDLPFAKLATTRDSSRGIDPQAISLDCLIPELGYTDSNLRVICWTCNSRKSNSTLDWFSKMFNWVRNGCFDNILIEPPNCTP